MEKKLILEMKQISKSFPGVKALDNVRLELYEGEVVALLGENGAGKSTLMKILSGAYSPDEGKIKIFNQEVKISSPKEGQNFGIATIYQELNLVRELSVAENVFLGREFTNFFGKISWLRMKEETEKILQRLDAEIAAEKTVRELGLAEQQMVEIAKSLSLDAKIIIMDEPTASLTEKEIFKLFSIIDQLRREGKSIIYISHRLEEVFALCDRLVVLRDGKFIGESRVSATNQDEVIKMMVGRSLEDKYPKVEAKPGEEVLAVKDLSVPHKLSAVSFSLRAGEVLGVAGLVGSGRTELAKAIFGVLGKVQGTISVNGNEVKINSPRDAIQNGIVYLSENRKEEGLVLSLSVKENITLPNLSQFVGWFDRIKKKEENKQVNFFVTKFNIRTPNLNQLVRNLSGGNQQKAALAKWMMANPKVLILDEPTRGIDVGAKVEIYEVINRLKQERAAIMVISSELPEVLGVSDRIMVMAQGRMVGILEGREATQEKIMAKAVEG